jgi:hypothetical protein
MAVLHNEAKTLRLFIELVDREVPAVVPGQPAPPAEQIRVLGTAGVEFYDRRDQSFWPFLRLPVLYLGGQDGPELVASIRDLCSLKVEGFAFRTGNQGELGVQLGRQPGGELVVEVGIDLAPYLLETAGRQGEPGRELAMFRFNTQTAELVRFADQVKQELEKLPPVRRG